MRAPAANPDLTAGQSAAMPLTDAQRALWFAQKLDAQNPAYNTGQFVEIRGPLDVEAFRVAIQTLATETDALSVRVAGPDNQALSPEEPTGLDILDDRALPAAREVAIAAMRKDLATPVDPANGRLVAERLYHVGEDHFLWYQRLHHIVTDGFASDLVTRRIAELYNRSGHPGAPLQGLMVAIEEDRLYRESSRFEDDRIYWRETLAGMPEVSGLKTGVARAAHGHHHVEQALDAAFLGDLAGLEKSVQIPWPDILTALVAAYCARFTGTDEVTVGVPFMNRFGSRAARVPTLLMNILPIRLAVDEDRPLFQWLRECASRQMQARRHGRYRHEWIRRDTGILGNNRRLYGPLVNILPFQAAPRMNGVGTDLATLATGPVDDITIGFRGAPASRLGLEIDANPEIYSVAETEAHLVRLTVFLQNAVSAALDGGTLAVVPTVTPQEHHALIEGLNDTAHLVPDTTLVGLMENAFLEHGGRPALRFGENTLTYRELDEKSAALAEALVERGTERGSIVAVSLSRSLELVVALVAILRAGAAYLPLDASQPEARLLRIAASARPVALLADENRDPLSGRVPLLPPSSWPAKAAGMSLPALAPGDPAYVIYTSGSTGEPKGVVVGHRAIVNRLCWMADCYGFSADDVILQKTPMTFDVSVWEFFLSFLNGGLLVVAPPDAHKEPGAIAGLIRDCGITTLHFVPSMLAAFLAEPKSAGLELGRVFCSGEELPADLRDRFHRRISASLHNLYGPTEAAVDVSYWEAAADDVSLPVPIGFPVWNTRLYVLDHHNRPVPAGVDGLLYIAGRQLADGYLGQPELTAERFVADPFVPGEKMYATGDRARIREDGAIIFLGRADHQVKLRGLRIELGEIEAALASHPEIGQVAVTLVGDEAGEKRLVAYLTAVRPLESADLAAHLGTLIPAYMMPSAFMQLDVFPLSANGKLDRKALPAPAFAGGGGRMPASGTEELVAMLFQRVLGLREFLSADDDFFALGGHSLLAVELMLHVKEFTGRDPGIGALFEHSTVARLADYIDRRPEETGGLQPLLKLNAGNGEKPPLFLIHPAGGLSWCYGALARHLANERPVWGLQAVALDPDMPEPKDLDDMARFYADRIAFIAGDRPVHLGGWSVGGILAHAVAVRLQEMGVTTGLVAMLDSYPCDCWRAEPDPGPGAELKALLAIGGHDPDQLTELPLTREAVTDFLRQSGSPLGRLPNAALDGMVRVVSLNNRFVREHRHERFRGRVLHVTAAPAAGQKQLAAETWKPYVDDIVFEPVPFSHAFLTGAEATDVIAPRLKAALAVFETTGASSS